MRASWRPDLSWADVIELRQEMQTELDHIRASRAIRPPVSTCPKCGRTGPEAEPRVSVRAMLLALRRFGIESEEVVRRLDKAWAKHRATQALDLEGRPATRVTGAERHEHRSI